jgi:DNA-3-methyladenine glycosylase I
MSADERERCGWAGIADAEYTRYHDEEWGVPQPDDRALFEKINLEAFQSGLSWLTILRKRENFRRAFDGFDPEKVARYGDAERSRLMSDAGIVRNRLKIEATIANAQAYLALAEQQSFAAFLWGFVDGRPVINERRGMADIPGETALSRKIAKELKRRGFRFVGPTTIYAFMQSVGMVNDHLVGCWRYRPCARLQRAFVAPR